MLTNANCLLLTFYIIQSFQLFRSRTNTPYINVSYELLGALPYFQLHTIPTCSSPNSFTDIALRVGYVFFN
jgi:hypothetical protein